MSTISEVISNQINSPFPVTVLRAMLAQEHSAVANVFPTGIVAHQVVVNPGFTISTRSDLDNQDSEIYGDSSKGIQLRKKGSYKQS